MPSEYYEENINFAVVAFSSKYINLNTLQPYGPAENPHIHLHVEGFLQIGKTQSYKCFMYLDSIVRPMESLYVTVLPTSDTALAAQMKTRVEGLSPVRRCALGHESAVRRENANVLEAWEKMGFIEDTSFSVEEDSKGNFLKIKINPDHRQIFIYDESDSANNQDSTVQDCLMLHGIDLSKPPQNWSQPCPTTLVSISATGYEGMLLQSEEIVKSQNTFVLQLEPGKGYCGPEQISAKAQNGQSTQFSSRSAVYDYAADRHIENRDEFLESSEYNGNVYIHRNQNANTCQDELIDAMMRRFVDIDHQAIDLRELQVNKPDSWKRELVKMLRSAAAAGKTVEVLMNYFGNGIKFLDEILLDDSGEMFGRLENANKSEHSDDLARLLRGENVNIWLFLVGKLKRGNTISKEPILVFFEEYGTAVKLNTAGQSALGRCCGYYSDFRDCPAVFTQESIVDKMIKLMSTPRPYDFMEHTPGTKFNHTQIGYDKRGNTNRAPVRFSFIEVPEELKPSEMQHIDNGGPISDDWVSIFSPSLLSQGLSLQDIREELYFRNTTYSDSESYYRKAGNAPEFPAYCEYGISNTYISNKKRYSGILWDLDKFISSCPSLFNTHFKDILERELKLPLSELRKGLVFIYQDIRDPKAFHPAQPTMKTSDSPNGNIYLQGPPGKQ
jgi:hypothetical protein